MRFFVFCCFACNSESNDADSSTPTKTTIETNSRMFDVFVHSNQEPIEGAIVQQPGTEREWVTDEQGKVQIMVDDEIIGEIAISAWADGYHIRGDTLSMDGDHSVDVELEAIPSEDNVGYRFQHPGTPDINENTNYCSHCHVTINDGWYGSVHQTSASNPKLWNLYLGSTEHTQDTCSGTFVDGTCYIEEGVLPSLNNCVQENCAVADIEESGHCSNCHAPGINGEVGDNDLRLTTGIAYDYGVHCDVCHKINAVDVEHEIPGVGGMLQLLRPNFSGMPFDGTRDLHFGPYKDVLNARMNASYRDFFRKPTICAGCHEYNQNIKNELYDEQKWSDGIMPVYSTYSELIQSSLGDGITCQSCHMPPASHVGNSVDLGNILDLEPDSATGWYRPAGQVRHHTFVGPRSDNSQLLKLAASVQQDIQWVGEELHVQVQVQNIGAGHAIPTGVPLRSLILRVEVNCDDEKIWPSSGDIVDEIGGYIEKQDLSSSTDIQFTDPKIGQYVVILQRTEQAYDYNGFAPFGADLDIEQRGWFQVRVQSRHLIVDVVDDEMLSLEPPLPTNLEGVAYLVDVSQGSYVGEAGAAFARVLVDEQNRPQVPSFLATDIQRDNRILPTKSWNSNHVFVANCTKPTVTTTLWHRNVPQWLAIQRGWEMDDQIMVQQITDVTGVSP